MRDKPTYEELEQRIQNLEKTDNEEQFQSILNTINEGIILLSSTGNILTWNKVAEEIFGIAAQDVIGQEITNWHLFHEDGSVYNKNDLPFIKSLYTGVPFKDQIMMLHKTPNDPRWVSINTNPLFRNEEDKPYAVVISISDITDKNEIETEIRKSETRFRELAELLPEAVFEADMELNLLFVNQRAFSMFGYSIQDFNEGLNGIEMLVPEDRKRAKDNFIKRLQGEIPGATEYRAIKKDGTIFPVLFHASPIIENEKVIGLRGVIIDITNTKLMERRLVESQKMESIGTLAGGIAHDFNNILSPIILHSEMTKDDLPEDDPLQVSIKEIYKASIRARDLVRQILTFARKGSEEKILLSASRIVKDTIKFLRSTIPATIEIEYDNRANNDTVLADPIQLNQVVMNLCTNAAYAMRKNGGLIEVILDNREITAEDINALINLKPGKYLELTVKDSGIGIPQKLLNKIFEPYFTTKDPAEGTGLGLAIIHGIVKNSGGSVYVDSKKNEGTTFRVYLPLIDKEASEIFDQKADSPMGTERILLVDDQEAGLIAMQKTLENLGYKVISSTSSLEAFDIFRSDPEAIDLLITDMTMPGMTGKDLIGVIRKIRTGLPTILYTGFSDQINEDEASNYGIDAFIMKPIVSSEIANTIRKVLNKRR